MYSVINNNIHMEMQTLPKGTRFRLTVSATENGTSGFASITGAFGEEKLRVYLKGLHLSQNGEQVVLQVDTVIKKVVSQTVNDDGTERKYWTV